MLMIFFVFFFHWLIFILNLPSFIYSFLKTIFLFFYNFFHIINYLLWGYYRLEENEEGDAIFFARPDPYYMMQMIFIWLWYAWLSRKIRRNWWRNCLFLRYVFTGFAYSAKSKTKPNFVLNSISYEYFYVFLDIFFLVLLDLFLYFYIIYFFLYIGVFFLY